MSDKADESIEYNQKWAMIYISKDDATSVTKQKFFNALICIKLHEIWCFDKMSEPFCCL